MHLREFTIETMVQTLAELAPSANVYALDTVEIWVWIEGQRLWLRVVGEPGYGRGLAWVFYVMGPNDWHENDPDESYKTICVTRADQIAQAVDLWVEMMRESEQT